MAKKKEKRMQTTITNLAELANYREQIPEEDIQQMEKIAKRQYQTYNLVIPMMYLIGVETRHFEERELTGDAHYTACTQSRDAQIIRDLCIIRTSLIANYGKIANAFRYEMKGLNTIPDLVPTESIDRLRENGIDIQRGKPDADQCIIKVNTEIANRIQRVQGLFPEWIKWEYIRALFQMPGGFKPDTIRKQRDFYYEDRNRYPFHCYINWEAENQGNILNSDEKFVRMLYAKNHDVFEDMSLVTGAGNRLLDDLYSFIARSNKVIIVVDCENSEPIKLAAALSSLNPAQIAKVHKLMLFDSDYTTTTWKVLIQTGITEIFDTEHEVVERLYEHKSQVDMTLAAKTCREVYMNGVDAVILVSSDSDYWALIKSLPETHFLVMLESTKSGQTIREALESQGYHYCFIDDFCTGAAYSLKTGTLLQELQSRMDALVSFNARTMLNEALQSTWVTMSEKEKEQFYDRYLRHMKLNVDGEGGVRVKLE